MVTSLPPTTTIRGLTTAAEARAEGAMFAALSGSSMPPSTSETGTRIPLWLDCDPGHDDACALLLAIHHPSLELLGVSTVGGNAPGASTCANAAQLLVAFGAPASVELWRGSDNPLIKAPRHGDVAIHGEGGLGGVVGLPALSDPAVQRRFTGPRSSVYSPDASLIPPHEPAAVVNRLAELISNRIRERKPKLHLAITGPCTNIALFIKMYPHLLAGVEQIVLMGGVAGGAGNRGPLAEFNILCDPEAAQIVLDADIKVVMAGLNVTHSAIFHQRWHVRLLKSRDFAPIPPSGPSPIRTLLSSLLTFFAGTYASEFGFVLGPPVHDSLAIMYLIEPRLFWTFEPAATAIHGRQRPPARTWLDTFRNKHTPADLYAELDDAELEDLDDARGFQGDAAIAGVDEAAQGRTAGARDATTGTGSSSSGQLDKRRKRNSVLELEPWNEWNKPVLPPQRYRVRVECASGSLAEGATVVDWWGNWGVEHEGWGRGGKNVEVLEEVDTEKMWDIFFQVVDRAEEILHPTLA